MKSLSVFLPFYLLFCTVSVTLANDDAVPTSVEDRLDSIQASLNLMFVEASEQIEALTAEVRTLKQSLDHLAWYSEQVKRSMAAVQDNSELLLRNVTTLTMQSDEIIANQQYCANHEALKNLFYELTPKCGAFHANSTPKPPEATYSSCADVPFRSGVYQLRLNGSGHDYEAYCEMDKFGGGWTVFQKRQDGSVDFNRSWADYRNGFGDAAGEYWLGLETLHQLTTSKPHEVLITMENFNGSSSYARYPGMVIDNERLSYKIYLNGSGNGTAADSLYAHRSEIFVTYDARAGSYADCPTVLSSGFWHYNCNSPEQKNNLNGVYGTSVTKTGIWWHNAFAGYPQYSPLKRVTMMIRAR